MPNISLAIGAILVALGFGGWFSTGMASPTALIPAGFGMAIALCGVLARRERVRKHAMHAAAALGLIGFLGSARGLVQLPALLNGTAERPAAVVSQVVMAALCLLFVVLAVRSFIAARRAGSLASSS